MPAAAGPRSLMNLQPLLPGKGSSPRGEQSQPTHLLLTLHVAEVTTREPRSHVMSATGGPDAQEAKSTLLGTTPADRTQHKPVPKKQLVPSTELLGSGSFWQTLWQSQAWAERPSSPPQRKCGRLG